MASLQILRTRRARWALPLGTVAALTAALAVPALSADADVQLPPRTAAELLVDVARAGDRPFSGTVVQTARLGLPELPGAAGDTSLQSLVSGSHTARVWYASPSRVRVSLIGDLAETDLVRRDRDVWLWSSPDNTATHYLLAAARTAAKAAPTLPSGAPSGMPSDPATVARQALALVGATTAVSVDESARVAGRPAYELVLAPKDTRSLVARVRVAVDGETSVPLRVQVFAKGQAEAAFETAFTSVQFETPDDAVFSFTPPKGATVTEGDASGAAGEAGAAKERAGRAAVPGSPRIVGTGWTSVAVLKGVDVEAMSGNAVVGTLLGSTTPVSGPFGTGRMLSTPLLSVLLLDDGTTYVGAVDPAVLTQAAQATPRGTR